jgi:hypothetical protein
MSMFDQRGLALLQAVAFLLVGAVGSVGGV